MILLLIFKKFVATIGDFTDYQSDIMDVCNSLHSVLSLLHDSWQDLHVVLIVYLRQYLFWYLVLSPLIPFSTKWHQPTDPIFCVHNASGSDRTAKQDFE